MGAANGLVTLDQMTQGQIHVDPLYVAANVIFFPRTGDITIRFQFVENALLL